jgi:hypothetical protein
MNQLARSSRNPSAETPNQGCKAWRDPSANRKRAGARNSPTELNHAARDQNRGGNRGPNTGRADRIPSARQEIERRET